MQAIDVKKILLIALYVFTGFFAYISIKSWIGSLTTAGGIMGINGQYVGRDFLFFYAAAKLVLSGHINELYTGTLISGTGGSVVAELANESMQPWAWLYPPCYVLFIMPLGLLPYYPALALWLALSLVLAGFVLWHFAQMRGAMLLTAMLNASVIYCLTIGQNALIFAAIAGAGIYLLKKRPLLAGLCFAILSMKPHFAILMPVGLILGRYWQALLYTIIGTLLLLIITSFAFGFDIWGVAATHLTAIKGILVARDVKFFSIYSAYRDLLEIGLPDIYAWLGYLLVAVPAFYGFCKVWLGKHDLTTKWLAFSIAALLCSPYNMAYDTVWVALPVMAWLSQVLAQNHRLPPFIYLLLAMQIFAFIIASVAPNLAILMVVSALVILLWIAHSDILINNKLQAIPV